MQAVLSVLISIVCTNSAQDILIEAANEIFGRYNGNDPRLGIIKDFNNFNEDFDFIIIGAGSSGSVIANRLTEVPEWNVLLLEAGGDENFFTDIPLLAPFLSQTDLNWDYSTEHEERACMLLKDGVCRWPRGKVLGGTSVLNFLIYTRGHPDDFNDWAAMGNEGWSYKDVLPYFKKMENVRIKSLRNSTYRGVGGYLDIEKSSFRLPTQDAFQQAAYELGFEWNDPNGEKLMGFSIPQATTRDQKRCSASKAYLEPIRTRRNLHVSKFSTVTRILIEPNTRRAYGVEFRKYGRKHRVRAKREIILSAGTIGSAQILMLSGIGPGEHLKSVGIKPIINLPVGENLQDHITVAGVLTYSVSDPKDVVNDVRAASPQSGISFLSGGGPLTIPGGAVGLAFVRTPYATSDYSSERPDMELVLGAGSLAGDTAGILRSLLGITDWWYDQMFSSMPLIERQSTFAIAPLILRPKSRGYMRLRSHRYQDKPILKPNYFKNGDDMHTLREGIKFADKIISTSGFRKLNTTLLKKKVLGCEHLPFKSDEYFECAIMMTSTSLSHQVGTCKMGPLGDRSAVVSPRLTVHGARSLRVADCSIMPVITSAHTHAPAVMIGEKAADIIKEDWGVLRKKTS